MLFQIAAVSFLNTVPLTEGLSTLPAKNSTLTLNLPSRLSASLQDGTADVALLPVADILLGETGGILPVAGIAGQGCVDSVKLFATNDIPHLTRIAADRGSHSSVALLRILLAETHGLTPEFSAINPQPGVLPAPGEGILIIGDRCFEYEKFLREAGHSEVHSWDLGQMWWELTELPFVFAVWAVAPGFVARAGAEALTELKQILTAARDHGLQNLTAIATREAAAGRLGHQGYATSAAIDYYFRTSLRYTIGDRELAGIRRFRDLAIAHNIIPERPLPPVL